VVTYYLCVHIQSVTWSKTLTELNGVNMYTVSRPFTFKLLAFCFCFGLFPTTSTRTVDGLSSPSPKIPTNVDQSFDPGMLTWHHSVGSVTYLKTAVRCGDCF